MQQGPDSEAFPWLGDDPTASRARRGVQGTHCTDDQSRLVPVGCSSYRSIAEELASGMLAHSGIAVIWDLQLAAAHAKRNGKFEMAASLLEIAEAAERLSQARAAA
jgi:hypothetical protein